MPSFIIGSRWVPLVRCSVSGVLTDPTTLTAKVRQPNGTETSYTWAGGTVTRDSLGVFHRDTDLNASGEWVVRYIATGAVVDAIEHSIVVPPSALTSP